MRPNLLQDRPALQTYLGVMWSKAMPEGSTQISEAYANQNEVLVA